ncbi:MAG TPA: mechanosensitive ion channel domain-containing protein [Geminicoccaceae bacterium]|nr:mechanosensitive ion channel domain-containing protein [Geminicoccaceae bacterium]
MDENEPSLATRVLRDFDLWLLLEVALVVLAATAAVIVIERATAFLAERASARFRRPLAMAGPLSRLVIIALALVTVIGMLIKPTPENLVALFGAVALAVGFALKDYVSSLFAGVNALVERPYRRHDWITIGGDYGKVRELGFRAVQIVTLDDTVVTIPHGRLWTENVKNANDGRQTLMCVADFYLHPDHDAQAARDRLRDVALTSAYLALDRPVTVIVHEQPWATHYRLKAYPIEADDQLLFTSDLTVRGKRELLALGCRPAGALAALGADV